MADFHSYRPSEGHGLRHDPLNSIVGPRPIGWISSVGSDGARNLAPYSFFNLFNYRPPIIGFASTGWKHSVANIEASGEFVWNLVSRDLAEAMNATSGDYPAGVDEFAQAGIEPLASVAVRPARVAAAPVQFECRLTQLVRLTNHAGDALDTWLVLGEAVVIHIAAGLVADGLYDTAAAHPILRGGGPADYFAISADERFRMTRPRV